MLHDSLSLRILTGLIVAPACAAAGWWLNPGSLERMLILTFSLTLAVRGIASWSQQVAIAYQSSQLILRQEALWRTAEAVLGLAALALGAGLAGIAAAHALSWTLQATAGLHRVHRHLHPVALGWTFSAMIPLLADGASAMLVAFSVTGMIEGGLILYRIRFPAATDVGQLAIVLQGLSLILMLPRQAAVSALPALSRFAAAGTGRSQDSMQTLLRLTLLAAAAMALGGAALGAPTISLVLGPDYAEAGCWLGPALWLAVPFGVGQLLNQFLFAHGDYWANAGIALGGFLIAMVSASLATALLGGAGTLLAAGMALTVWTMSLLWLAQRRYGLTLGPLLRRAAWFTTAAALTWFFTGLPFMGTDDSSPGSLYAPTTPWWPALAGLCVLTFGASLADWTRLLRALLWDRRRPG